MPNNLKGGFKSKNGLVTYGMGGSKKKMTYGMGGSMRKKQDMMRASKGLEALAAANPELTYKKKAMYGGGMKKKYQAGGMTGMPEERMKRQMRGMGYGGSHMSRSKKKGM
jgi:hypothetical protein